MENGVSYVGDLVTSLTSALPGILAGLAVMAGFFIAAGVIARILRKLTDLMDEDRRPLLDLARQSLRYALYIFGVLTGLGTMGIDVSAMVAGLGLTGFALGFALRDAVSNLLAGVLIILYRPFGIGDRISVGGTTGRVKAVNFRYTELEGEGVTYLVPNASAFSNTVTIEEGE